MGDANRTTVFHFVCSHCHAANEYHQTHLETVRPHLVSTRCSSCNALNWLGGLEGTLLDLDQTPSPATVPLKAN